MAANIQGIKCHARHRLTRCQSIKGRGQFTIENDVRITGALEYDRTNDGVRIKRGNQQRRIANFRKIDRFCRSRIGRCLEGAASGAGVGMTGGGTLENAADVAGNPGGVEGGVEVGDTTGAAITGVTAGFSAVGVGAPELAWPEPGRDLLPQRRRV